MFEEMRLAGLADPEYQQTSGSVRLTGPSTAVDREPESRAGELAEEVGSSPSALSRHLKLLLGASIVEDERIPEDARVRVFKLRPDSLAGVQAYLDQLQAEWSDQLRSFKQHVEDDRR